MGNVYSIRLDVPIPKREAVSRGLQPSLGRLLLEVDVSLLVKMLYSGRPKGTNPYVHAINSFVDFFDQMVKNPERSLHALEGVGALEATDEQSLEKVLASWKSEILVIFFSSDTGQAHRVLSSLDQPRWWKFSRAGFEAPYLRHLDAVDPFFFFSSTRSSLEAIGTRAEVLRWFNASYEFLGVKSGSV